MQHLIWLVPGFPLAGVLINGLLLSGAKPEVRRRTAGWIATACVAASFVVACVLAAQLKTLLGGASWRDVELYRWIALEGGQLSIPAALRLDGLSTTMMLVVTGVGALIHLFSIGYMAHDEQVARYFTYLNLFTFAMLILVLANNFVLLFVGWEGVGLCSYLLIGFWFERVSAAQAGKKAFLINRIGDAGFLLGMFLIFRLTGTLVFNTPEHTGVFDVIGDVHRPLVYAFGLGIPPLTAIALLLFLGCTGKSAQLPLYMWLPDAMEGPTPVSALIHAATMVTAGVYLVARAAAIFGGSQVAQLVVAAVGIVTAAYAAWIAIRQYDIKRVLAYSTVSQLGFMFVAVGVGAYAQGILHLVTHAFFKALLFLGAGAVMHALDGQLDLRKMGNLKRYLPVTHATFAVGWLAIIGVPPFSGFFSKDLILEGAMVHGKESIGDWGPIIAWAGVVVAGMTAFYMTRLYITVFHGPERIEPGEEAHGGHAPEHAGSHARGHGPAHAAHGGPARHPHVHPESPLMNAPLVVLALLSFAGGWLYLVIGPVLEPVTTGMLHAGAEAHGSGAEHGAALAIDLLAPTTIGSLAAAAIGALGAWLGVGPAKFAQGWSPSVERLLSLPQDLYDGAMHRVFVVWGTRFSEFLALFDRYVVDGLVNFVGGAVEYLADSLRSLQTGYVRNYALVMLAGVVFVVACFMLILQQPVTGGKPLLDPKLFRTIVAALVGLIVLWVAWGVLTTRRTEVASEGAPPPA